MAATLPVGRLLSSPFPSSASGFHQKIISLCQRPAGVLSNTSEYEGAADRNGDRAKGLLQCLAPNNKLSSGSQAKTSHAFH